MKITLLEISNFKRIKALRLEPNENGLTVIGGVTDKAKRQCWTRLRLR